MAANHFAKTLAETEADLDSVGLALNFLGHTARLVTASADIIPAVAANNTLRKTVVDFRKGSPADFNTFNQALYIQAFACYEAFLRNIIQRYVECVGEKDKTYEKLATRNGLLERNIYHTGFAFQQIFENQSNMVLDFDLLIKNLSSAKAGSASVTLNAIAFALKLKALRPKGIHEALNRIGVDHESLWDTLGASAEIKRILETKAARDTGKAMKEFLSTAVKRRNNIVHKGHSIEVVGEATVAELLAFFKAFNAALAEYLSSTI